MFHPVVINDDALFCSRDISSTFPMLETRRDVDTGSTLWSRQWKRSFCPKDISRTRYECSAELFPVRHGTHRRIWGRRWNQGTNYPIIRHIIFGDIAAVQGKTDPILVDTGDMILWRKITNEK